MSISTNAGTLSPEERIHQVVKIWTNGAIRYAAASQVDDTIQTVENEDEDRNNAAEKKQPQEEAA